MHWMTWRATSDRPYNPDFKAAILRYFNVFGGDPEARLGEFPRPELRHHGRISGRAASCSLAWPLVACLCARSTPVYLYTLAASSSLAWLLVSR